MFSCAGTLPRIKLSFFLLLIWTDDLFSTTKIATFLSQSKSGNEKIEWESNPVLYTE